jgi:hypothetical protein
MGFKFYILCDVFNNAETRILILKSDDKRDMELYSEKNLNRKFLRKQRFNGDFRKFNSEDN